MRLIGCELGALLLGVARAAPQEIIPIFPIKNATSSTPTPTTTQPDCVAQCSVYYPQLSAVSWVPRDQLVYTQKVIAGTISYVVVTSGSEVITTRTTTSYNEMPTEYNLYRQAMDESGTAVVSVPVTYSKDVYYSQIAYPSNYVDYFTDYHWEGVLPTHDKAYEPICVTATPTPNNAVLYKHPEYPQPKAATAKVDENDPYGYDHEPIWVPIDEEPDKLWFDIEFPSESAFLSCTSAKRPAPTPTVYSVPKFVFDSTTTYTVSETRGIIIQSSATGWEEDHSTVMWTPSIPHFETTQSGFEPGPTNKPPPPDPTSTKKNQNQLGESSTALVKYETTATGFDSPDQTRNPNPPTNNNNNNNNNNNDNNDRPPSRPPSIPEIIASIIINNPEYFPRPTSNPAAAITANPWTNPTPVFTYIPTVINGVTTSVPAYLLPGPSGAITATATIGQEITLNGTPTILGVPGAVFTSVRTTIDGTVTFVPAYVISGASTASIGQTVVVEGKTTVLGIPSSVPTQTGGDGSEGDGRAVVSSTGGVGGGESGAVGRHPLGALNTVLFGVGIGLGGVFVLWL